MLPAFPHVDSTVPMPGGVPVTRPEEGGGVGRCAAFLALLVLLLAARSALCLSLSDVFFYGEELEKGAAAKAMLDGVALEHHQLAYHYYEGGGFAISHLDALAFLAVGENLLALKLVALLFNALILFAGCALCERNFGRGCAVVFGLLFVFAPESFQKNSLLALGIHFQALLFVLLILHFAARAAFEADRSRRTWLALGLASGLGIWFSYGCLPVAAYAIAFAFLRSPGRRIASTLWGGAGLAVGLLPLALLYARVGGEVFDVHGASLLGAPGTSKVELVRQFLDSIYRDRRPDELALLLLLPLAPLLGAAAVLSSPSAPADRLRILLFGGALVVFLLAYLASGFTVGAVYHYFLFHRLSQAWLLASVLAAAGIARFAMHSSRALRTGAWSLLLALTGAGMLGLVSTVQRGEGRDLARNWSVLTRTKGYAYEEYFGKIQDHIGGGVEEELRALLGFREPERELLEAALATNAFGDGARSLEEVRALLEGLGLEETSGFALGLGPMLRAREGEDLAARMAAAGRGPEDWRSSLEEAVGRFGLGFSNTEDRLEEELRIGIERSFPDAYFRGVGYRLWHARGDRRLARYFEQTCLPFAVSARRALAFIAHQDARIKPLLLEGYQRAVRAHMLAHAARALPSVSDSGPAPAGR